MPFLRVDCASLASLIRHRAPFPPPQCCNKSQGFTSRVLAEVADRKHGRAGVATLSWGEGVCGGFHLPGLYRMRLRSGENAEAPRSSWSCWTGGCRGAGNGGRHPSSADSTVGDRCAPFNGSSSGGGAVVAWAYENEGTEAQSEQARRQRHPASSLRQSLFRFYRGSRNGFAKFTR